MWFCDIDIFNESDFFENIFCALPFVQPPVNNGNGQIIVVFEQYHCRHWREFIDLPSDLYQIATGIFFFLKGQSKEQIRFDDGFIYLLCLKEKVAFLDVVFGELEEDIYGLPVFNLCFFRIKIRWPGLKVFGKSLISVRRKLNCPLS